ncbi:hypothetical protein RD792_009363 [Penstemon davidsonii]|uniref:Uncharacterized protein n=1 Tax=Penstemon davidsonii TaxID=160366 RepID=A0ABR0CZL8_9LAMI|nr:hypothetical protein RD792_009363 [Penstemon davidsonii]
MKNGTRPKFYMSGPPMPQMIPPPGAPPLPGQINGLQRPVTAPPQFIPGSAGIPTSGAPPMFAPPVYQGHVSLQTSGSNDGSNNAQGPEDDR